MSQVLINSPCIGVCTVAADGLCMGCFRTMDEITAWLSFSENQRARILAQLPARMEVLFE